MAVASSEQPHCANLPVTVHNVTKEEIPQYVEMVTAKFQSRSISFKNIALFKMNHDSDFDITVNGWPQFDCTRVTLDTCVLLLAGSQEGLEKFLVASNYNPKEDSHERLDEDTNRYLSSVRQSSPHAVVVKQTIHLKSYIFPENLESLMKWSCPNNAYVAKLKMENMNFISEFWGYLNLELRVKLFERLLKGGCSAVGLFLKDSPTQPVSWVFSTEYGTLMHAYTLAEHRRKGYAKIVVLELIKELLEAGMTPQLAIDIENTEFSAALKLYSKLGFVESHNMIRKIY